MKFYYPLHILGGSLSHTYSFFVEHVKCSKINHNNWRKKHPIQLDPDDILLNIRYSSSLVKSMYVFDYFSELNQIYI